MFLKLFKGAQPGLFVFVPVFAVLLWLKYFLLPQTAGISFEPGNMPFYALLTGWLEGYGMISKILALAMLILLSLWLSRLNTKFIIIGSRTYLPTFLYLVIVSAFMPLQQINPAIIAAFFLLYSLEIMFETYKQEKLALKFFLAAFLVSLASFFYARSAYFMLVVWAGLVLLRPFLWREWVFTFIGFLLPYVFLFSYYYLAGEDLHSNWILIRDNLLPDTYQGDLNLYYALFYGYLLLLILAASLNMLRINQGLKIYIRKFYRLNFWIFVLTLAVYSLLYSRSVEFIYFFGIPVSLILAQYLHKMRSRLAGEILLGLLLGLYGLILVYN